MWKHRKTKIRMAKNEEVHFSHKWRLGVNRGLAGGFRKSSETRFLPAQCFPASTCTCCLLIWDSWSSSSHHICIPDGGQEAKVTKDITLLFEKTSQKTHASLSFSSHWPELGHMVTANGREVGKYGHYFTLVHLVKNWYSITKEEKGGGGHRVGHLDPAVFHDLPGVLQSSQWPHFAVEEAEVQGRALSKVSSFLQVSWPRLFPLPVVLKS